MPYKNVQSEERELLSHHCALVSVPTAPIFAFVYCQLTTKRVE
jgi:hypothetical protein